MERAGQDVPAVTDLLVAWRHGDEGAHDELFDRVYSELRRIARAQVHMRSATMAPTELVHEMYLKLLGGTSINAVDRGHFFSLAARAMRHILVDVQRRRRAVKRGGANPPVELEEGRFEVAQNADGIDLLALDYALERLAELNPRLVKIVELRHFAGLSVEETARELGLSQRTVKRDWRAARAYLFDQLDSSGSAKLSGASVESARE